VIEAAVAEALRRGEGDGLIKAHWTEALLHNGLGRYDDALAAAEEAGGHPPVLGVAPWAALAELVEAAARSAVPERGAPALRRLTEVTHASGTDWALGIEARSRALLSRGDVAERAHREALDLLGRTRIRGELARAHLLYGEWLRRAERRPEARDQLRTAHDLFTTMGMEAFARRAATSCSPAARPCADAPPRPPAASQPRSPRSPGSSATACPPRSPPGSCSVPASLSGTSATSTRSSASPLADSSAADPNAGRSNPPRPGRPQGRGVPGSGRRRPRDGGYIRPGRRRHRRGRPRTPGLGCGSRHRAGPPPGRRGRAEPRSAG
jgi:hypothetical protein